MSNSLQFDHHDCCGQCGAPKVIWRIQRRDGLGLSYKRSYFCCHQCPTPRALRTIFPSPSMRPGFSSETHTIPQTYPGSGIPAHITTNTGSLIMDDRTMYPLPNMAVRPVQSNESLASQIPLAYHMTGNEAHFSPATSHFPSPGVQSVGLPYQQVPHLPYNSSPLNPDHSFVNHQSGHANYMHGHPQGHQMYPPQQQHLQLVQHPGHRNTYQQQHQIYHGPGDMAQAGYTAYSQGSQSSGNFYPVPHYGAQNGFVTSQLPYQGHSNLMGYGRDSSQYAQAYHGQQTAYQSTSQENTFHNAPSMAHQGEHMHQSGGYGYSPAQNHPQLSGSGSFSNEACDSESEEPEYKSSGFVPPAVLANLRASQSSQVQSTAHSQSGNNNEVLTSQPTRQAQPFGHHYESSEDQENDSGPTTVENSPVHPLRASLSPHSFSPRAAPATDPLPARSVAFVGSPENSRATETPSRHSGDQISHVDTPATLVQSTESSTPHLRSRKGQSVSTLKIDPVRGPPPAFWPGTSQPAKSALAAATPGSIYRGHNNSTIGTASSSDPFMANGSGNSPVVVATPVPQGPQNPFVPMQPAAGPLVPLVLPAKQTEGPSRHLATIAPNANLPTIEVALEAANLPFIESARVARPVNYGVVKITNIPYNVTRSEIVAFLGRNARIVNEAEEPIHIIMERVSSKTMEAYVEFVSMQEAVAAVNRYEVNRTGGRGGRLGERHVELEVSGQEKLMQELFPKARNVHWDGSIPVITPNNPNDPYNSGFQGFVTTEEMVMLVKHVEAPQRSPFSKDCPQRPFECLISTLVKHPWYMVDDITLEHRDLLFKSTRDLVQLLVTRLNDEPSEDHKLHINDRLLRRVRMAVCRCPGFTERQKDDIAFLCGLDATTAGLTQFADHWSAFMTIGPKPGIQPDVLHYYVALLREATTSGSLAERAAREAQADGTGKYFGTVVVDYPENFKKMTLGQIAKLEWNVIEMLLRKRLQV